MTHKNAGNIRLVDLAVEEGAAEAVKGGMTHWGALHTNAGLTPTHTSVPTLPNQAHPTPFGAVPGFDPRIDVGIKK